MHDVKTDNFGISEMKWFCWEM